MEAGQNKFFDYILECVIDEKQEDAKILLLDNFKKQQEGTFSKEDVDTFHKTIVEMLKPERQEEVIAIMKQFGDAHISKNT